METFLFCLSLGRKKKIDFPLIAVMDGEDGGVIRPSSRQMPKVSQKDKSCFLPYFTALSLKQVMFCGLDAVPLSAWVPGWQSGTLYWSVTPGRFSWSKKSRCRYRQLPFHSFVLLILANERWLVSGSQETVTLTRCSRPSRWFSAGLW